LDRHAIDPNDTGVVGGQFDVCGPNGIVTGKSFRQQPVRRIAASEFQSSRQQPKFIICSRYMQRKYKEKTGEQPRGLK